MKKILFIALLALMVLAVVPASASDDDTSNLLGNPAAGCIWHNEKCYAPDDYAKLIKGSTVIHNSRTGVDSKYKDTNPAKAPDVFVGANTCTLEGNVRAGYNTLTKEVEIKNVNQVANESGTIIQIQPDGTFRYDGLAAGDYVLRIIAPFEGVGPDQYSKLHCERGVARPESELLGYAVTTDGPAVCQREILHAEYGKFNQTCYGVVVSQEWTEHFGKYNKVCDWWYRGYCLDWDYVNVGQGNGDYTCKSDCCYKSPVVHPATYAQRCDAPNGIVKDVTSNVREALGKGYTSFLFNNAENPGGIFDVTTTTLVSTIDDPAPGHFKHVSIDYKDCNGIEQHVSEEEYQQITLL